MREFINKFGWIVVGVCVVTAVLIWFFTRSGTQLGNPQLAFYIDDVTGEESVQSSSEIPPLLGKDGKPTLVQVVKISCHGGKDPYVAYYIKYTDDAKAKLKELNDSKDTALNGGLQDAVDKGKLIRLPAPGSPWVPANSTEGQKIQEDTMCKNGQPSIAVYPP